MIVIDHVYVNENLIRLVTPQVYPGNNIYERVFITELIRDMQRLEVILTFSLCRTRVHDGGIKKVAGQFNSTTDT